MEITKTNFEPKPLKANPIAAQIREDVAKKFKPLLGLHASIIDTIFTRIMTYSTPHEAWSKLEEEFKVT